MIRFLAIPAGHELAETGRCSPPRAFNSWLSTITRF